MPPTQKTHTAEERLRCPLNPTERNDDDKRGVRLHDKKLPQPMGLRFLVLFLRLKAAFTVLVTRDLAEELGVCSLTAAPPPRRPPPPPLRSDSESVCAAASPGRRGRRNSTRIRASCPFCFPDTSSLSARRATAQPPPQCCARIGGAPPKRRFLCFAQAAPALLPAVFATLRG